MKYDVPLIPQTSKMSCWAASIAMILGWKQKMSIPDKIIARNPGGTSYMTSYAQADDGPRWVATWAPGPHIRVVTGMNGTTLSINDPWPVGQGDRYACSFDVFGTMEELGGRELNQPSPVYVAHLS